MRKVQDAGVPMSLRIPQIQRLAEENFQKVFMEAQEAESQLVDFLSISYDVAMRRWFEDEISIQISLGHSINLNKSQ